LIDNQKKVEDEALILYNPQKPAACINFLTKYTNEQANKAVDKAWDLGDLLWTKYNGMW
jgi:hypothetical protein